MDMRDTKTRLIAAAALGVLAVGGAGVWLGQTAFAPAPVAAPADEHGDDHAEGEGEAGEAEAPEGALAMDAARIEAAGVALERVQAGGLGAEILAQGVVVGTPTGEAVLTARADGTITSITKRLGETVRAGETIARMESREAASIAAERSTAAARLALAQSAFTREKRLFDARVTARQDLEGAQAALAEARAEAARTQASAAAAKVGGDGRSLAVISLISGRVTEADARLGAYVLAGTELFRVADPTRVQVNASVLAEDARRIQPGDRAAIELPDGEIREATVASTTPSLDPQSRTVTVVLQPASPAGLTPGLGLRVRIVPRAAATGTRVALPEEAVQSVEGRDVVFVRTATGFQATPVTIGQRSGGRVEIMGDLAPGVVVATRNAFLLKAELGKAEAEHAH